MKKTGIVVMLVAVLTLCGATAYYGVTQNKHRAEVKAQQKSSYKAASESLANAASDSDENVSNTSTESASGSVEKDAKKLSLSDFMSTYGTSYVGYLHDQQGVPMADALKSAKENHIPLTKYEKETLAGLKDGSVIATADGDVAPAADAATTDQTDDNTATDQTEAGTE
ncbi:hypothetical protein [Weissella viridescens]|uniref:hypothetical protein n=1 Tax=Weissella viridescens TaxID=1629 RepID=UPI0017467C88|nr:hypothetical protein [Weissella viridescens]QOD85466.1 hypothetical protein IE337_04490 [Weissella viridescens]